MENLGRASIGRNLFDWLMNNLPFGDTILEIGSGYGTRELIKHWKVYSIEDIYDWAFKHACHENYIYAPLVNDWYDTEILKTDLPNHYDLILIDGPKGKDKRGGFIKNIELFNTNTIIVVDDTQRNVEREHIIQIADYVGRPYQLFEERDDCQFGVIQ